MEKPNIHELFSAGYGRSEATESSWPELLSELHQQYILSYIGARQAEEAAAIEKFLASRERSS